MCALKDSNQKRVLLTSTYRMPLSMYADSFLDLSNIYRNIIVQCVRESGIYSGTWQANGQFYQINGYFE